VPAKAVPLVAAAVPTGCQFVPTANGSLTGDGWITGNGAGPVAQITGTCVVGSLEIEVDSMSYAPANGAYNGVGLIQAGVANYTYHRNSQLPQSMQTGWSTSYPTLCFGGNVSSTANIVGANQVFGQPTALKATMSFTQKSVSFVASGSTGSLADASLPQAFAVTAATPINVLPLGCWAGAAAAPAGTRVRLLSVTEGVLPPPPVLPAGCQFVPTANGTLGADGWITSNGGSIAARVTGNCSVSSIEIEVDSMTYAPANGAYNGVGLIGAGIANYSYHRNSQAPQSMQTGWGTSYPTLCFGGNQSPTKVNVNLTQVFGQPTALNAKLSFAERKGTLFASSVTGIFTDSALPVAFAVTNTTPINIFPTSCGAGAIAAPAGSRVRLVGITGGPGFGLPAPQVLGVANSGGVLKNAPLLVADPVNSATGAFDHSVSDMSLPGRGEELSFGRNYDSRQPDSSVLGKGWWHPYFQSVTLDAVSGALRWRMGNGGLVEFPSNGAGGFSTPVGIRATASVVVAGGWQVLGDDQTRYTFDAAGKLVSIADRSGQGVSVVYDASGRVSVLSNSSGKTLTLTYGTGTATTGGVAGTGRLIQVKGSDNRTVKYAYTGLSGSSLLTSVTDVRAKVWLYSYDVNGFLERETDPNANVQFVNTFDATGRVVAQLDQLGNNSTFAYNDAAGTTTLTDASGAVRVWNRLGNVPNGATDPAGSVSTEFNAALDATSFTDATGHKWTATYDGRGNMLSRTSPAPLSYSESWSYDSFNNPVTYVDARGATTTYTYDSNGRLLTEARPGGVNMAYSWNADGTLATSTDPRGGVTTYVYDANGWLLSQTTPLGFKTSYVYDAAGRVLNITEPRGNVVGATATSFQQKFTYDADGNVLTERDALNRTTTHVYDNGGRRTKTTAPDGGITLFEYNAANELVKQTAPDGGITLYEYDNRGLRTKETSPIGAVTTFGYDPAGRLTSRVDPRGNEPGGVASDFRWLFTYDAAGRQKTVTDPIGRVTTTNYDQLGRVLSTVRPDGTTSQAYDQNGNVTSSTTEAGTTSQVFDPLNRVSSSTDLRGKTSAFGYDLAGNRISVTDPLSRVTTYAFDADGRMVSMVDARGNVAGANPADFTTSFLYDEAGNQVQVTDPLGLVTKQVFDRVGNVATSTNAKNLNTTFLFDSMNRTTRVTAPVVGATNYTYTNMGYVASRTDPLSTATTPRVASWSYDLAGRTTEKKDAAGRRFTFGFDVAGNQTSIVDANANAAGNASLGTTTMTYDRLNRLTETTYSDGTPTVTRAYNEQGQLRNLYSSVNDFYFQYDAQDRLQLFTKDGESQLHVYTYDAAGNVLTRNNDGTASSATYDDAGQVVTVTDSTGTYTLGYDPIGNLTHVTYPGGVTQTRVYDRAARLGSIVNTGPTGPIGGFSYLRDANGNPTLLMCLARSV
jgi:YD repeat-containing protein